MPPTRRPPRRGAAGGPSTLRGRAAALVLAAALVPALPACAPSSPATRGPAAPAAPVASASGGAATPAVAGSATDGSAPGAPAYAGSAGAGALEALVEAERAFSATASRLGPRLAFIAHMDTAVVQFGPAPARGLEGLRAAEDFPTPFVWAPEAAGVSASGDLGWTTGPVHFEPAEGPAAHAQYFSVWRRAWPGAFRVVADVGVARPGAVDWPPRRVAVEGAPPEGPVPGGASPGGDLADAEAAFQATYAREGAGAAYRRFGAPRLRVHRSPEGPVVGLDTALAVVEARGEAYGWEGGPGGVARADDLGWTFGVARAPGGRDFGFVRVWRRDVVGRWRIVAEVVNAPPGTGG